MRRKATRIEQIVAAAARSGDRVYVRIGNGTPVAELWLNGATLVAALAEGGDHRLGARLISTGHLARSELDRSRTAASKNGMTLAVTLSERVRRDVITALARDEARYALAAALAAPEAEVEASSGDAPGSVFTMSVDATDLLTETHEFLAAVREAQQTAPPHALPVASETPPPDLSLGPEEWSILSRADGTTTIARLAEECGFPAPEASLIVTRLAQMGLLTIDTGADAAELLAELEAAEDLAAITAAFEHAAAAAPDVAEEPHIELPPLAADDEPAAVIDELPAAEPAGPLEADPVPVPVASPAPSRNGSGPPTGDPAANGDRDVDTQALLRELSAIARSHVTKND